MMRPRWIVALVWAAFVVRGVFYCALMPLWEGLDEWAHFAAIQWFAGHGRMPARSDPVSDAVVRSLELAPLPWSNNGWVAGAVNHDEFGRLTPEEQGRRRAELAGITARYRRPESLPAAHQAQYEGQQPPLYYAIMALPFRATEGWPIERQAMLLRVLGVLLASAAIPLGWSAARRCLGSPTAATAVAALTAAMAAVAIQFSHIANDAPAFALMTLAVWTVARTRPRWVVAGLALAAALLCKGYALILLPVYALAIRRERRMAAAMAIALVLAGWWYAGNLVSTGTIAGEQMDVASRAGIGAKVSAIPRVAWGRVLDSAATTHIWIGGWSFLQVRSWMYRVWEGIALLALCGLVRGWMGGKDWPGLEAYLATAGAFAAATAYFSLNAFVALGTSVAAGWYSLSIAMVEATLVAAGFVGLFGEQTGTRLFAGLTGLAAAFDFYTVIFVLAPYYQGLIRHHPSGALEAYHWNGPPTLPAVWPFWAAANLTLVLCARPRTPGV